MPPRPDSAALSPRLRQAGLRHTRAVRGVAALFESAGAAWSPTHAEVAARLARGGEPVNAVTLYRLLERLVAAGLLARHTAPGERAWRFQWRPAQAGTPAAVPHFECDACHTQFPLPAADAPTQAVADALRRRLAEHGHQAARVDLAVHGICAGCRIEGGAPEYS